MEFLFVEVLEDWVVCFLFDRIYLSGRLSMDGEGSIISSEVAASLLSLEVTESFAVGIKRVNRVCVVGAARSNAEVTDLLKNHFGIELLESEDGYEFTEDANITFCAVNSLIAVGSNILIPVRNQLLVQQLFENVPSMAKYCQLTALLIISFLKTVVYLASLLSDYMTNKPLLVPRPNRPLYTDSMSGVRIALSGLSTKNCREAVDLVHFMGGSAQRIFSASTTHLITDTARGKTYRMAVSIGCRVMHLDWLRAAWDARNSIQTNVTTIDFMNRYMVEPFCGLSLWFVAYSEKDLTEMKEKTLEYKGKVAANQKQATHIVVSTSLDAKVEGCDPKQHLVSGEWFWISVQLNCCANETIYKWKGQRTRHNFMLSPNTAESASRVASKSVSKSSMEILDSSNCSALPDYSEHLLSTDDPEILNNSPRRLNKRYAVCKEMLETEENYLRALKIVVQVFKEPLEAQLPNTDSGLLTKAEISQIFAKIPPLIDVHENICRTLQSYIMHWMNERLIGKIWLDHAAELTPIYKAFINNYDTAIQTLNECDQTKPKFHAFLKAAESRIECQRNSLPDLLVRPVQRLHSVVLLLKAILEKTDRKNPDNAYLVKAKRAVEAALTEANESRRQTDSYAMIFKLSSEIERCPADILSSARTLKTELHVLSLGGEDEWVKTRSKHMAIFLFNDLIEIVKVRTGNEDSSTPTRRSFSNYSLTKQLSFSVLRHNKKKYKHYQQYMLASIRRIQRLAHTGEILVYKLVGRNTLVEKVDFDKDPSLLGVKENVVTIKRVRNPFGGYQTLGTPRARPQNQFRRAMSTVHLGISNTLSRLHSRSNLHPIDESFERTSPNGRIHLAGFTVPTRGFRQMLSTSTFLPSLGRRDSIFSNSIKE
ncbi:Protein ECT2 [Dirofilaria immitis]|nr:Protein ECT2 [Dirofilaria immitis]